MPAPHGHPRLRALAKWLATALTVLLIAAWLVSGKWGVAYHGFRFDAISLWRGRLWLYPPERASRLGAFELRSGPTYGLDLWMSNFKRYGQPVRAVPLWWLATPALVTTIALWRHDLIARRRAAMFHCPKCGYDLAGLLHDAKCPECGAIPASV